ncbi:DUF4280 domain-containing protein [Aequorivita capsosiphonis]|uniref:DUF4280 domain-containing protein n=1 Tax=Aequorivita capsosiphonis TaxID=487317 RepID=UPI00040AA6AE|nr:DUF4280 domain-containing protein [Aequorivita capsosiphonis]
MARRYYLTEAGQLKCTLGSAPGKIKVTSQSKLTIKNKLQATKDDKLFEPPFFGTCSCNSQNPPCQPALQEWQFTSKKSARGQKSFIMDDSQIQCNKGGLITVENSGQKLAGTGKEETELDKKYAKLQGEIIFVNGYFSPAWGGRLNAIFDIHPDKDKPEWFRSHNTNEANRIDEKDYLTDVQLDEINNMTEAEIEADRKNKAYKLPFKVPKGIEYMETTVPFPITGFPSIPMPPLHIKIPYVKWGPKYIDKSSDLKPIPQLTQKEIKDLYWGYWNKLGNKMKATENYAEYFNAAHNEHFVNGSHGLGSNAAHRIDHGIALGYHWAKHNWHIKTKTEVDDGKEEQPYIESDSPNYRPITIVMHSQGNAPGVGIALGILKYAKEKEWEQIPLNLIYLGVHQPKNLWEEEYEAYINAKVKYYGVNKNFWDGYINSPFLKEDKKVEGFLNGLSELFDPKYHKLRHKRGIYEHLWEITDFQALAERAVQFTFTNDRGDLVSVDGDIPYISSACNPIPDNTLYSVEFFAKAIPEDYPTVQGKEIINLEAGGSLVIPPYAAIPRLEAVEDPTEDDGVRIDPWEDYRSVATDWGNAYSNFNQFVVSKNMTFLDYLFPVKKYLEYRSDKIKAKRLHRHALYSYGRIQEADLYAHFSPVEFILDDKLLKTDDFKDALGDENIWDRLKKLGGDRFYRVEYDKDPNEMSEEEKRMNEKTYVEGKGLERMIMTSISENEYVTNVLKAYVDGDKSAEEQLYHEPIRSDKEMERIQKLFGSDAKNEINKQLLKDMEVKRDNTRVVTPPIPPIK